MRLIKLDQHSQRIVAVWKTAGLFLVCMLLLAISFTTTHLEYSNQLSTQHAHHDGAGKAIPPISPFMKMEGPRLLAGRLGKHSLSSKGDGKTPKPFPTLALNDLKDIVLYTSDSQELYEPENSTPLGQKKTALYPRAPPSLLI